VVILGIVLAILVMVLAALISSAIKRHRQVQQIDRNSGLAAVAHTGADSQDQTQPRATRVTVRLDSRAEIPAGSWDPAKVNAETAK
jgi:hypothetical protein